MAASLRTLSCSPLYTVLRSVQLGNRSQIQVPCRSASFLKKFWKGSSKSIEVDDEEDDMVFPRKSPITSLDGLRSLKKRTGVNTKRGYTPPEDVEERIQRIADGIYGEQENWKDTHLTNRAHKYKFLTETIKEFNHNIPNMVLTNLDKVNDVVLHFSTEVMETSALEDISKLDLPENLHINLDYIKFNEKEDTLFGGKTAYPGRPTIIHSIKHKRQYKVTEQE
ncbi:39S ribosomal protein L50, mitochondrial-like [Pecten maximus]|uniref:39S ribosomal protein L50, mitochondrial-like n=1 Tax=Pecten maximus TaxID=6579 RepID=UPI001458B867|nr:39S ribosomal protein L50, mitochondrial-like [Pecten maximus]